MAGAEINHDKTQESESESYEEELIVESDSADKMEEGKEVEVCEENGSSKVSPSDTLKGSKVQEEGGQENQDNLEGDGNDDAGLEVYGKDSKEVSIPETLIASQGEVSPSKVKVKAGGMQKDSPKVSTRDDLKASQSKGHAKG
eukprot:616475-Ditylum_brightwellii.AAC.1